MLENSGALSIPGETAKQLLIDSICLCPDADRSLALTDLGNVIWKLQNWRLHLPRVTPFYAVKCNDDVQILRTLAAGGCNFDCASRAEIDKVLQLGVAADRIVFANPCKAASHVKFAKEHSVDLMTFDNEHELLKVQRLFPNARLVLRILPPAAKAQAVLGNKFGALPQLAPQLIAMAKELRLNVVGVSFHVGSGCLEAAAFANAVVVASQVFQHLRQVYPEADLLDIGGGFPGDSNANVDFGEICALLNDALNHYFPTSMGVQIIAEPGRYMVSSAVRLAVCISGKRCESVEVSGAGVAETETETETDSVVQYYVNDGVYGSFNCILYDHQRCVPLPLLRRHQQVTADDGGREGANNDDNGYDDGNDETVVFKSTVFGPTCDGLDVIVEDWPLPLLDVGDWMVFENMGAYTFSAASAFNGMPTALHLYGLYVDDGRVYCWPDESAEALDVGVYKVKDQKKVVTIELAPKKIAVLHECPSG